MKGATCPAFCYRITVRNSGPDVPLVNVTVSDPDLNLSGCSFATSLAPGETTSCVVPNVERCASVVNTVTAKGASSFEPTQTATATDTATVTVVPISVSVAGTAVASTDHPCIFDTKGQPISSSNQCSGLVECQSPCLLSVAKTACVVTNVPTAEACTGGAVALTLKYTGETINSPTIV